MSYFHKLAALLFCFSLYPSYSVGDPVDLISFNVYRNGTKTFGHLKVPSLAIKSDFFLHQRNATHMQFDIFSKDPYRLAIGGSLSASELENGLLNVKGRLNSLTNKLSVNFDSKLSLTEGHKLETKIDFAVPNAINGTYLFNFSSIPNSDSCYPINFAHNLTTYPPGLIEYHSGVKSSCANNNTNVDLDLSLKSNEWSWLKTDLKQIWSFNSTGGYESMNATLPSWDIDVIANWTNAPHIKKFKMANFRSKTAKSPSFRIKYLVDGDEKKMIYENI